MDDYIDFSFHVKFSPFLLILLGIINDTNIPLGRITSAHGVRYIKHWFE